MQNKALQNIFNFLHFIFVVLWLEWLKQTDAHFIPYLLVALFSLCCIGKQPSDTALTAYENLCLMLGSCLFSLSILLSNYAYLSNIIQVLFYFVCSCTIAWKIFYFLLATCSRRPALSCRTIHLKDWQFFILCMAVVSFVDLSVFLACKYPGVITNDTRGQLEQIYTGSYSNHHPFFHTQIIQVFFNAGFALFGNANNAIALYCVFQIMVMSAVFSYVLITLYQQGLSLKWIFLGLAWYAFMPFHVMYSFTIWKDILWGGSVGLFITSLYRIFFRVGNSIKINYVLMSLGAIGFCLLRSNGWLAFLIFALLFSIFFGKQHTKTALLFWGIAVFTYILKKPFLDSMGVTPPDTIEHLSIPAQQIARVIRDGEYLSKYDYNLLSQIIDISKVPDAYLPYLSDPIKDLVREKGKQTLLVEQKSEYLKLWIRLGLSNKKCYLFAWIDQTKGYFNAGYPYWVWTSEVHENIYDITRNVFHPSFANFWENYCSSFLNSTLSIFVSIGFHIWLAAGSLVLCIARFRWKEAILIVPIISILLSLLIATPVAYEFRYIYALFVILPLLLFLPFGNHASASLSFSQ